MRAPPMLNKEIRDFDIPDLNRFRIGDAVIAEATDDCDRIEGVIIGIELKRSGYRRALEPSITLLYDGDGIADGFKPSHLRKVDTEPPAAVPSDIPADMEKAAKWHERQALLVYGGLSFGSENWEYRAAGEVCDMHRLAAKAIRATPKEKVPGVIAAFEQAYPELDWHVAKGKITPDEPLYGAIITTISGDEIGHGESSESADAAFSIAVASAGLATTEG